MITAELFISIGVSFFTGFFAGWFWHWRDFKNSERQTQELKDYIDGQLMPYVEELRSMSNADIGPPPTPPPNVVELEGTAYERSTAEGGLSLGRPWWRRLLRRLFDG